MRLLLIVLLASIPALAKDRVTDARARRTAELKTLVEKAGLTWPVEEVYLRGFKKERQLELWAGKQGAPLTLVKTYPWCAASGELGPKRVEGDLQVPEGLYEVPEFNATSNYHLAMKVSYPNASDRVRTSDKAHPGGLIYLHGNCVSIGCIAIEDGPIEEVYLLALDSRVRPLRFDLFPMHLTPEALQSAVASPNLGFWTELLPAFAGFEASRRPVKFKVDAKTGAYVIAPVPPSK